MSYAAPLPARDTFAAWRDAARIAISHRIAPNDILWGNAATAGLFPPDPLPKDLGPYRVAVSKAFLDLARSVIWHRTEDRFHLLYQALWRLDAKDGHPLSAADPLGRRLALMTKSIRRDIHKMHAFLRFRELPSDGPRRRFAAWFEPEHHSLEPASGFFVKRFSDMDWQILTPDLSAHFLDGSLRFDDGAGRPELPEDASEALWGTYFANIFNPARVKLTAMRSEMPKKYWKNLPETRLIPSMLQDAEARVARMQAAGASTPRAGAAAISTRYRAEMPKAAELPQSLSEAERAASLCRNCQLCEAATQTVWGEGPLDARLMILGEQPGDREDLEGRPFIGPAGQLLRQIMADADIDPARSYLTNAVKHFKFAPRGKQRLHKSPVHAEVDACRRWLGLELAFIQPDLTIALGATAAFALTGDDSPLSTRRGRIETGLHGGRVLLSWHPSYILRLHSAAARAQARDELRTDLIAARRILADQPASP